MENNPRFRNLVGKKCRGHEKRTGLRAAKKRGSVKTSRERGLRKFPSARKMVTRKKNCRGEHTKPQELPKKEGG